MIEVRGDDEAIAAVGAMAKEGWKDKELGSWAKDERDMLEYLPYPPTLPNQQYRRTGRLALGYRVQRPRTMVRVISNRASTAKTGFYGGYVIGQRQAPVHQGRWYIATELVEADLPKLIKRVGKKGIRIFEAT